MQNSTQHAKPRVEEANLKMALIGALALNGAIDMGRAADLALRFGYDPAAAGDLIATMVTDGLASVSRDSSNGELRAAAGIGDLPRQTRISGILRFLTQPRGHDHA